MVIHTYIQETPRRLRYCRSFATFDLANTYMKRFHPQATWHNFQRRDIDDVPEFILRD